MPAGYRAGLEVGGYICKRGLYPFLRYTAGKEELPYKIKAILLKTGKRLQASCQEDLLVSIGIRTGFKVECSFPSESEPDSR